MVSSSSLFSAGQNHSDGYFFLWSIICVYFTLKIKLPSALETRVKYYLIIFIVENNINYILSSHLIA
jgi:hypothetical protein